MRSTYVSVRIDVDDVLRSMSDNELVDALEARGIDHKDELEAVREQADAFAEEMERHLLRGDTDEALLLVQRRRNPKFKTIGDCVSHLSAVKAARKPATVQ